MFLEDQANKNTLSKTKRDVWLLKEFIRMKEKDKKFENVEPRELEEILCVFIQAGGKKKDGGEYEPVVCIQFWPLYTEEGLPHSQHRRTRI